MSNIQEELATAMQNKNPAARAETLLFMARSFQLCTPDMLGKPFLKAICPVIVSVSFHVLIDASVACTFLFTKLKFELELQIVKCLGVFLYVACTLIVWLIHKFQQDYLLTTICMHTYEGYTYV